MKWIRVAHTGYGLVIFSILFFLAFPVLLIPIFFPQKFRLVGIINRWWARTLFFFLFIRCEVVFSKKIDRKTTYIFCPNHFSYLDIPTLGLNPANAIFVGKNDMEKIPLFGFMYRKLHITVNRSSIKSRGVTLMRSLEALEARKSLVIYPEGGIISSKPPHMSEFKDGAFRAAIEKKTAIVPVTIPHNWKRLPDVPWPVLHAGRVKIIFHDPIESTSYTIEDMAALKSKVFNVIQEELKKHYPSYFP